MMRGRLDDVRPEEPPSDVNIELDVIGDIDQRAPVLRLELMHHVELLVCWLAQGGMIWVLIDLIGFHKLGEIEFEIDVLFHSCARAFVTEIFAVVNIAVPFLGVSLPVFRIIGVSSPRGVLF